MSKEGSIFKVFCNIVLKILIMATLNWSPWKTLKQNQRSSVWIFNFKAKLKLNQANTAYYLLQFSEYNQTHEPGLIK